MTGLFNIHNVLKEREELTKEQRGKRGWFSLNLSCLPCHLYVAALLEFTFVYSLNQ